MRCYICDSVLSPESTRWNAEHEDYDPCPTCLMIISEVFDDPLDEGEISYALMQENPELFCQYSQGDKHDPAEDDENSS